MTESAREQDFRCPVLPTGTPCFVASRGLAAACEVSRARLCGHHQNV